MLLRPDRILLRVPSLPAAVRFYRESLGLTLIKQDPRLALLRFPQGQTEIVLHTDPDLPADAVYYLVDDVRNLFARRAELKLNFVQPPTPTARGHRAAIKDPFGNVLLLLDRSAADTSDQIVEDAKPPGALFAGVTPKIPVNREALSRIYQSIGRTADDLPYTPDFERLHTTYAAEFRDNKPSKEDTWRHLLNIRKAGKLPKLGDARSKPPDLSDEHKQLLRSLLGPDIGKRDRLPYTKRFDQLVDHFNKTQPRPLSPHLVWRLVATLAK
jgi:catechol 2,3-dioxygenase-like lactoylglutathione lyase family enzyme